MIPESLPPLLRALGTTLILVTSASVIIVERNDGPELDAGPTVQLRMAVPGTSPGIPAGDTRDALAQEVRLLREQLHDEDLADEVFGNAWFQILGLLGTALIAGSFYTEWLAKRAKRPQTDPEVAP